MTNKKWLQTRRATTCITAGLLAGILTDVVLHVAGNESGLRHESTQALVAVLFGWLVWSLLPTPPWHQ